MANVEILFLLVAAILMPLPYITEAAEHVVGGASGWIIPLDNPSLYSSFAATTTFRVNDTLGQHRLSNISNFFFFFFNR